MVMTNNLLLNTDYLNLEIAEKVGFRFWPVGRKRLPADISAIRRGDQRAKTWNDQAHLPHRKLAELGNIE
jgi:hypothetical protein